ncbi:hypothetical protein ILYODFUR_037736 [Ilyodon furcidens]|uniref:Uncharacterized protein n=1 Tax=Ilyodon furcidens TaxID=33524 RepID=A0ABV0UFN3_9TELE
MKRHHLQKRQNHSVFSPERQHVGNNIRHMGIERSEPRARDALFWPGMGKEIANKRRLNGESRASFSSSAFSSPKQTGTAPSLLRQPHQFICRSPAPFSPHS